MSGSVLDRDTESKAILKIAGREIHSDGYREMNMHEWDNWILNDEFTLDLKLDIWGHGRKFAVGDGSLQPINFLDKLSLQWKPVFDHQNIYRFELMFACINVLLILETFLHSKLEAVYKKTKANLNWFPSSKQAHPLSLIMLLVVTSLALIYWIYHLSSYVCI